MSLVGKLIDCEAFRHSQLKGQQGTSDSPEEGKIRLKLHMEHIMRMIGGHQLISTGRQASALLLCGFWRVLNGCLPRIFHRLPWTKYIKKKRLFSNLLPRSPKRSVSSTTQVLRPLTGGQFSLLLWNLHQIPLDFYNPWLYLFDTLSSVSLLSA